MAKPRSTRIGTQSQSSAPVDGAVGRARFGVIDAAAIAAALCCIAAGYLSRLALNPDGVSYLDLAAAMQRGDWSRFVQGYWSPLFPLLTGFAGILTGLRGPALVSLTHGINTIAAVAAVVILWRWGRTVANTRPLFAWFAIAAFLLCSAGLPRIEAVTPDVLSLLLAVWLSRELLTHGDRRWLVTGVLLGAMFLIKTSAWPWLVIAVPLRVWAAADAQARRRVWWSTAACAVVMLAWIAPMSVKAGAPTLGSSGRLNYSWYIQANTSRLPDGDRGVNSAYRDIGVGDGQKITVATYDDAEHWTYQPWGDPTAWAEKVMSDVGDMPTADQLVGYWVRMFGRVFGLWLLPMILATMLPAWLLHRRKGAWRELVTGQRDAAVVMALGLAGLLQFTAIHAEPRLIAPFGIMLALATIWWCTGAAPNRGLTRGVGLLRWLGLAAAFGFAVPKLVAGVPDASRLAETATQLDGIRARLAATQAGTPTIAVIGPAAPALAAAYWTGAHVAMQIPPRSAQILASLPTSRQVAVLTSLLAGRVSVVWKTSDDGGLQMLIVPKS